MSSHAGQPSTVEILENDSTYRQNCESHPVEAKLMHRVVEQIDALLTLMAAYSEGKLSSKSFLSEFNKWWPRFIYTLSWLHGDFPTGKATPPKLTELMSAGFTDKLAMEYLSQFGKRRRGRPVSTRQLAVMALEMKARNPKLSWAKLAIKFSTPEQVYSKDAIRREATRLAARGESRNFRIVARAHHHVPEWNV